MLDTLNTNEFNYENFLKLFHGGQHRDNFDYPLFCRYIVEKGFSQMVELGNYYGWSCCFLGIQRSQIDNNFTIHAVDLHDLDFVEESENYGYFKLPILRKRQFQIFQKNMIKHKLEPYINVIQGYSWEVASQFLDCSVDYVFIDADHQYESVKKDIVAWLPKIKPGGIIAGHDYISDFGVYKAVRQCFNSDFSIWDEGKNKIWYKSI